MKNPKKKNMNRPLTPPKTPPKKDKIDETEVLSSFSILIKWSVFIIEFYYFSHQNFIFANSIRSL